EDEQRVVAAAVVDEQVLEGRLFDLRRDRLELFEERLDVLRLVEDGHDHAHDLHGRQAYLTPREIMRATTSTRASPASATSVYRVTASGPPSEETNAATAVTRSVAPTTIEARRRSSSTAKRFTSPRIATSAAAWMHEA